jgi:phosphoribosylaminoimidazolecarboxamide formyltransferase/IMP cyclohydrolase
MSANVKINRVLISVSDKTDLREFASGLDNLGIEIISTGGTLATLKKAGIKAISVSTFTGAPEILGGRVKTLHPKIHAGILFRRESEADKAEMAQQEYRPIDMVVVNLYPFEKTVRKKGVSEEEIIENIDIGGPTMVRAAAKNFAGVAVVTSPADYKEVLDRLREGDGSLDLEFRRKLAARAFELTCNYDRAISDYFNKDHMMDFPKDLKLKL